MNIESRLYGWLSCLNLLLIIVKLYTIFNNTTTYYTSVSKLF